MDPAARVDPSPPPAAEIDEPAQVRYAWRALSVVGLASVLIALNASTLNVALPDVVRHFRASPLAANWILLSYMLAGAVLLLAFGRLADLFGRRAMYLAGLSAFTLASLLLGLAPNVGVLIGLRVVQAAGGAMLTANSAAIVADAFPPRLLSQGMGIYAASFSVAQLAGPSIGGLLADHAGWRWVFWFNVPVGMLCLLWSAVTLRAGGPGHPDAAAKRHRERIDLPGNLVVFLALGSLLFALSHVQEVGRVGPLVAAGFATFAVLLPLFLVVEHRSGSPLVDLALFRHPPYVLANLAAFAGSMARFAVVLLMALFFRAAHADSAFAAGLKVMPLALGTITASTSLSLLARWFHPRSLAALGSGLVTGGLVVLFFAVGPHTGYGLAASGLALVGLGSGVFLPANTTAIMADLPADRLGTANALRLLLQRIGVMTSTALGLAIVTGPLAEGLRNDFFAGTIAGVSGVAVGQLVAGYHRAFAVLIAISALGVAACLASRRAVRTVRGADEQESPP